MKKSRALLTVGLAALLASQHPRSGQAVQRVVPPESPGGLPGISLEFNFQYPPSRADLDNLKAQVERAQEMLCDATDGIVDLREVFVTVGNSQREDGDVWLYPSFGRSESNLIGGHVTMERPTLRINQADAAGAKNGGVLYSGGTIAHELGHLILGVGDSYEEQFRGNTGCGIGPSFGKRPGEVAQTAVDNSIMQEHAEVCRFPDGTNIRDVDPRWSAPLCGGEEDCMSVRCERPGCPTDKTSCSATPVFASELSIGQERMNDPGNFDKLAGKGELCPTEEDDIRHAKKIVLHAAFNDDDPPEGSAQSSCGNGAFEPKLGEQCDPTDPARSPAPPTCASFGLKGSDVDCENCKWSKSGCMAGVIDGCPLADGPEKCTPGDPIVATCGAATGGPVVCEAGVCVLDYLRCKAQPSVPGSSCGDKKVDPARGEQCDEGTSRNGAGFMIVNGPDCSTWFKGDQFKGRRPACSKDCQIDRAACLRNPCFATASAEERCIGVPGQQPMVPAGAECGAGFPGGAPACNTSLCSIDFGACGGGSAPFNPATFTSARDTSTARPLELEVVDQRGLVAGSGGKRGVSMHLVYFYAKHTGNNAWDVWVLGRQEEYAGGTKNLPVVIERFQLEFDATTNKVISVDGMAGSTGTLTLGGPKRPITDRPPLTEGTGAFIGPAADPLEVAVDFSDVVEDTWFNFNQNLGRTAFFPHSEVQSGPDADRLQQVGLCTREDWCRQAWNPDTGRFEGTDHRIRQVGSDFEKWKKAVGDRKHADVNLGFPVGDWEFMKVVLDDKFKREIQVDLPAARPDPGVPKIGNRGQCGQKLGWHEDVLGAPDGITLVIDRSGSMVTPVDAAKTFGKGTGESRLAFAQAAARGFADLIMLRQASKPKVGLVSFDQQAKTETALVELISSGSPQPGQMLLQDFKDAIDDIRLGGRTAIGRGMAEAEKQLDAASVNDKAIIVMSDGENNEPSDRNDPNFDPRKVAKRLGNKRAPLKPITIYSVPAGNAADKALMRDIATNGRTLGAPGGDELPPVYAEALARLSGDATVLARTPLALAETVGCPYEGGGDVCPANFEQVTDPVAASFNSNPSCTLVCKRTKDVTGNPLPPEQANLPTSAVHRFRVEQGAHALNLMISSRNAKGDFWNPLFRLKDPAGNTVMEEFSSEVVKDAFYSILSVRLPDAGEWTLELASLDVGEPQFAYVVGHVENPDPVCLARMDSTTVLGGQDAMVHVSAYHGRPLATGVSYTGKLVRPDRSEQPLTFEDTGRGTRAVIPASVLHGRGIYEVRVTCEVEANARFSLGEKGRPGIDDADDGDSGVPRFVREAQASFVLDTTAQPPLPPGGDCNNNGVPDGQEPAGDRDGDGLPDVCDDDPKGDDDPRPPNRDGSCTGPDCPVADAGPDSILECNDNGKASGRLDGSGSHDPNQAPLTFAWSAPPVMLQDPDKAVATGLFPIGATSANLTVSNGARSASDSAVVAVLDRTPPVLTVPPDVVVSSCAVPPIGVATATDGCGGTVTITNDAPPTFPVGITRVKWIAVDQFGNETTEIQTVTVNGTSGPSLTAPADLVENSCSVGPIGSATAQDACGVPLIPVNDAPATFPVGTTDVAWKATDALGRTVTRIQKVTVTLASAPPPTLTLPPDVSFTSCHVQDIGRATGVDACGAPATITSNMPARFRVGATTLTWTATDNQGRTSSGDQTVTITNAKPPVLNAPPPITSASCAKPNLGTAFAEDDCGVALTATNNAPPTFPLGTTVVTWSVTDGRGSTSTASQNVTLTGTAPPTLNVPSDRTITSCNSPSIGTATGADSCGGSVTITNDAPAKFPLGTTVVTWRATDKAGQVTTKTQRVTAELADDASCCPSGYKQIRGTSGDDNLPGTSGNDCIMGLGGNDQLFGQGGNDVLSGGTGNDNLYGDAGDDRLYGGAGLNGLYAGEGSDLLVGGADAEVLNGGPGADRCEGRGGGDNMAGGDHDDTMLGGDGDDIVAGDAGNDQLFGENGNDQLQGSVGNDMLDGGSGTDTCSAAPGTDTKKSCER
jgi:hypothetical protein